MKYRTLVFLIFFFYFSNSLYSQRIRLSEAKPYRGLHVFLMPGKSPAGERLLQFSFIKLKKLQDSIKADSIVLSSLTGRQLTLCYPKKLINGQTNGHSKQWYSTFSLNQENIDFIKKETIADMYILVNNRAIKIALPDSSRIELHHLVTRHF